MIIGLTGQIGAGKSSAASILASFGAYVIDADKLGRTVVETSAPLRRNLVKAFGPQILNRKKLIDRKKLAQIAFATPENTAKLNRLVHPPLIKLLQTQIKQASRVCPVVLVDAALLLQWGFYKKLDQIILITAPQKTRFQRMTDRGITLQDAAARQKQQPSAVQMRSAADIVISNSGTTSDLAAKLIRHWSNHVLPQVIKKAPAKKR